MPKTIEAQLKDIIDEYTEELEDQFNKSLTDVGEDTSQDLKNTSPRGPHTEHYADGWTSRKSGKGLNAKVVIYNKLKPGLTHLLENGHESYPRGRVKAIKHIEPAEKKAIDELMEKLNDK